MYNYYRAYGLRIKSEIVINEMLKTKSGDYDLLIEYGYIPQEVVRKIKDGQQEYYSRDKIWFTIKDVATYYISNGSTIIVQVCRNADYKLLRANIIYTCIGLAIMQRNEVVINGSSSVVYGNGIIVVGDEDSGRSILSKALAFNGYPFLSDNISVVSTKKGIVVKPGIPYNILKENDLNKMKLDKNDYNYFIDNNGQIDYLVDAFDIFFDEEVKLKYIFKLISSNVKITGIEEVKGTNKVESIISSIYKKEYINNLHEGNKDYYLKCSDIARKIKVFNLLIPKGNIDVNKNIEIIENIVLRNEQDEISMKPIRIRE